MTMPLLRRMRAEAVGTFVLVFGGCGTAVLLPGIVPTPAPAIALAFGLALLAAAYALGHVSGAHLNPAVTVGLVVARRFPVRELLPYVGAQVLGAVLAAGAIHLIASGKPGFDLGTFAANGYEEHSPSHYSLQACAAAEGLLTMVFVMVVLGATDRRAPAGFAPLAIGFALTLVHLVGIPVTNVSVNPARSTGPAAFVGGWAVSQLWLFWAAPVVGGALGALLYRDVVGKDDE